MDCRKAQIVMALYIANDPTRTQEEQEGFESHLRVCPECAQDYRESRLIISVLKEYGTTGDDTWRFRYPLRLDQPMGTINCFDIVQLMLGVEYKKLKTVYDIIL